jgi:hypothetical protein
MAKIKIKYVDHFTDRHGSVRYYFRRGGKRIGPLPGAVGLPNSWRLIRRIYRAIRTPSPW